MTRAKVTDKNLEKNHNILVIANLDNIYAYSGRLKNNIPLEGLNKENTSSKYILISSETSPKRLVIVEGELPLSLIDFEEIQNEDVVKLLGRKLSAPAYIAKLDFPELIERSIKELWTGQFSVEFAKENNINFNIKRNLADELGNKGNPENIKRNIDVVKLRTDVGGGLILDVEGWALSELGDTATVALYFDDEKVASTIGNKMRQDVLEFYKINIPITPGFILEAKVSNPPPKSVRILIRAKNDAVTFTFGFDKIPGASKYVVQEETIFKEFIEEEVDSKKQFNLSNFIGHKKSSNSNLSALSIIIPTNLSTNNIFDLVPKLRLANPNDEIIIIGHGVNSLNKSKLIAISDRYVHVEGRFNWSKFNNRGAAIAKNKNLIFLNDDVLPISPNWRESLDIAIAENPDAGVIGARLIGKDLKVQHDGISMYGKFTNHINVGQLILSYTNKRYYKVDAVTGAFLFTTKIIFNKLNGFDESLQIIGNDLDYCLRVGSFGKDAIIPTNLFFYHAEGSSRSNLADNNISDSLDSLLPTTGRFRNLDTDRPIDASGEKISLTYKKDLDPKNIAIVKVDHIGDFYSVIDSIKYIKNQFPNASVSLVCSPEVASIAKKIEIFTNIYPVRVFNKISGSGLELKNFPQALKQKKFDVTIDFRKHEDVRFIFENIKANNKFAFSKNTAATSEGTIYFSGHEEAKGVNYMPSISDEYMSFANFVTNCLKSYPIEIPLSEIKDCVNFTYSNPRRIAIFPQSGNNARLYPLSLYMQYAILQKKINPKSEIKFYVPSDQVGAYIGLDSIDVLKANKISVIGLNETASIIDAINSSDLVVTNNTGPMWMASNLHVPCIAVFSAVVSRTHWLPKGVYQISRLTNCSPCYVASADQCHRNMFCLNSIDPSYINLLTNFIFSKNIENNIKVKRVKNNG